MTAINRAIISVKIGLRCAK